MTTFTLLLKWIYQMTEFSFSKQANGLTMELSSWF